MRPSRRIASRSAGVSRWSGPRQPAAARVGNSRVWCCRGYRAAPCGSSRASAPRCVPGWTVSARQSRCATDCRDKSQGAKHVGCYVTSPRNESDSFVLSNHKESDETGKLGCESSITTKRWWFGRLSGGSPEAREVRK
jgi:hypothetical protein